MTTAQTPPEANIWEDVIQELFRELAEIPAFWRDQPRPFVDAGQKGFVTLFVIEDTIVGVPETRLECDLTRPQGQEIEPTIAELHRIALQVQVETYDNQARQRGRFFANRIRTRLRREETLVALGRVETSLIDVSAITPLTTEIDNRVTSLATMTIRLHTATVEVGKRFGYIDVIRLVPALEDEAGNAVPLGSIDIDLPDP